MLVYQRVLYPAWSLYAETGYVGFFMEISCFRNADLLDWPKDVKGQIYRKRLVLSQ